MLLIAIIKYLVNKNERWNCFQRSLIDNSRAIHPRLLLFRCHLRRWNGHCQLQSSWAGEHLSQYDSIVGRVVNCSLFPAFISSPNQWAPEAFTYFCCPFAPLNRTTNLNSIYFYVKICINVKWNGCVLFCQKYGSYSICDPMPEEFRRNWRQSKSPNRQNLVICLQIKTQITFRRKMAHSKHRSMFMKFYFFNLSTFWWHMKNRTQLNYHCRFINILPITYECILYNWIEYFQC